MDTTLVTVSTKGQVVLPAEVRRTLAIADGDRLAVHVSDGVIMLKPVKIPSAEDFKQWMDEARDWAASVGYQEEDVDKIIKSVRRKRHSCES